MGVRAEAYVGALDVHTSGQGEKQAEQGQGPGEVIRAPQRPTCKGQPPEHDGAQHEADGDE